MHDCMACVKLMAKVTLLLQKRLIISCAYKYVSSENL